MTTKCKQSSKTISEAKPKNTENNIDNTLKYIKKLKLQHLVLNKLIDSNANKKSINEDKDDKKDKNTN